MAKSPKDARNQPKDRGSENTTERIAELERQLRHSQKMETLGVLAGGIAHDFNNLLTGILGFSELGLKSVPPDSPAAKRFKGVMSAGIRARDLVHQILSFSRIGEQTNKSIELGALVKEALGLLRASIPKTIDLVFRPGNEDILVLADPSQFHQIVMNLCTNAYHAIGNSGTISISLTKEKVDMSHPKRGPQLRRGEYAKLSVTDTGCGMSPELIERIFEPFFTTKGEGAGTGLGLSLVNGIVEASGGAVIVESTLGKGSTFHVYFPLLDQEILSDEVTTPELIFGSEHILFVDDEEMLVMVGSEMLSSLGYKVTGTTDSADALAKFIAAPKSFDVVITDQAMPKISGLDLIDRIIKVRPEIPVILTTGYSREASASMQSGNRITRYLQKPYVIADLSKAVILALRKGRG